MNKIGKKYRLDYARRLRIAAPLHVNIIYLWFNLIFLSCMLDSTVNNIGQLPCASASVLRYTASVLASVSEATASVLASVSNPAALVLVSVSASSALVTTLLGSQNFDGRIVPGSLICIS